MRAALIAGVLLVATAGPASAMSVQTFLSKAEALRKKGPLALFSGDLKLLTKQIKSDGSELRAERLAAKAAGRPTAFCPPSDGVKLTDKDVMVAMQSVPAAERSRATTKEAMRSYMARRFPCRG